VRDNLVLSRTLLDRFSRRGWLDVAAVRQFAAERVGRFQIVCPSLDAPVSTLSGGNQQRVIVARELASSPAVLVAANPSRGLDMGAAAAVTAALRVLAREGAAVVLISTDLDEVMELSDDVCVLSRGRLSPPVAHPLEAERLGRLMAGAPPS